MNPKEDPPTEDYLDFELEIGTGSGRVYPVAVVRSAAGEAREQMQFPLDDLALENHLLTLQNALLRSGGKPRHILLPEEQSVQDFGLTLFNTLFVGEIGKCYAYSWREADQQGKGLRVKLRILSPEMAAIPWEFLYDPGRGEYVCLSRNTPVVRYLELSQPPQPLAVTLPLRILGMIATPTNLPPLDVQREQQRMEKALEPLQQRGLVQLTWLPGQTWREVLRAMQGGPWHIFHFIGHGSFDPLSDEGMIAFADEQGQADLFRATQLARLLADHRSLRLVVLNACESAKSGRHDVFSSAAAKLVGHGIPAVLAMQYTITDAAAIAFSRVFYETLADGVPIDAAVSEARKAVCFEVENTLEWGIPVLFMRSPDGVLFTVSQVSIPPPALRQPSPQPPEETPSVMGVPQTAIVGPTSAQRAPGATPQVSSSRIGLAVTPTTLSLTPGQAATVHVSLTNLGDTVDRFTTTVEGVPPDWVQGIDEAVQLDPGMHETVELSINVARSASNPAGDYPVTIHARSREKPNEVGAVQAHWRVLAFKEDELELKPRRASGRGSAAYTVMLHNWGNAPAQYELSGEDDEQKLAYAFRQNPVALEPGREVGVPLQVSTQRHWFGRGQRQPFQVQARPAGSSSPLTTAGELVNKAMIPGWLLSLVSALLVISLALVFLLPIVFPPLVAPQQVSPANGAVFTNFPRTTKLTWKAVSGAASYTVQIYYYQSDDTTCTGGTPYPPVTGITETRYTFNFIADLPGCWQVWAVDSSGRQGIKSPLWEFSYEPILPAPQQVSPANHTVFTNFPRTTKLTWKAVRGAVSYTVQIYYYQSGDTTCTGGTIYSLLPGITKTIYTFDFAGALPGCWQVWGVDSSGRQGKKSPLWEFSYTR